MGHKIVNLVTKLREGSKLFSPLAKAEYAIYRGVGYRKAHARTLVGATNVGAGLKYLSSDNGIESDGSRIFQKSRFRVKTRKPYKARRRRKRYCC